MTVEIRICGEDAGHALRELAGLAGGLRERPSALTAGSNLSGPVTGPVTGRGADEAAGPKTGETGAKPAAVVETATIEEPEAPAPQRERGKPAPGRSRRTKEEIAEDEAADAADQDAADEPAANISTGEERVDPEEAAQDKADEKAEIAASTEELTRDDVKAAMVGYVSKFGMAATHEDGPKIFVEALGTPPEGEEFWKLSLVPEDDQAALAKAIEVWGKCVELNPFKREAVNG